MKRNLILILLFISLALVLATVLSVKGQLDIDFELEYAEAKITNAFKALRVAESKGAEISPLVVKLNDAILLLEEAREAYSNGSLDEFKRRTTESSLISSSIEAEARVLTERAIRDAEEEFRMLSAYTFLASIITLSSLLLAWRIFKARYKRRILEARPEVAEIES
ncbi:hypothetical protein KEJ47_09815 [Candidatus Bathyarchaeota archaeon]|nr:hypothetical protein [Candidatus Bathyarchaeota archaeon]